MKVSFIIYNEEVNEKPLLERLDMDLRRHVKVVLRIVFVRKHVVIFNRRNNNDFKSVLTIFKRLLIFNFTL